ncbi:recombinase family protein [Brevundimonas sp.]|uniref:recombinase family protein n=1 Tax=Brevundimonas sp. TaxID=1871086 RepID=UPI0034504999
MQEIHRRYAAGASPRAIAADLNAGGVPGPTGKMWNASALNGDAERGNGILHNELYRGVNVFGRHIWVKNRKTGRRQARTGVAQEVVRADVPELRIVPEELWGRVRALRAEPARPQQEIVACLGAPPASAERPTECGECGGPLVRSGSDRRFVCSWRRERGDTVCSNGRSFKGAEIEARVLAAVKTRLLAPERVALAVEEARLAAEQQSRKRALTAVKLETELAELRRRADRLVDQVAEGVLSGAAVKERLDALETRRAVIEAELAQAPAAPVVALHPRMAEHYRAVVDSLERALARSDSEAALEARDLVRKLIETVVVTPLPERGKFALTVQGKIAALVNQDGDNTTILGAGAGFEPATFRL